MFDFGGVNNDLASRSPALSVVQCYREDMRRSTVCCSSVRSCRCLRLFLSLSVLLAASQFVTGQGNGTIPGCYSCPEGHYNDIERGCQPCTKCIGDLVELSPCGSGDPDYCDIIGQFDTLCCETYEYDAYGECELDCTKCEVTGKCKSGLTECDCPSDRYGTLCQYKVVPPPQVTTPAKTSAPPSTTHASGEAEKAVLLETWHFALIALGIVVGVVAFAALCAVGSFCQYNRRMLRRQTAKPTVSSVVIDSRCSSTATMSSNTSSDSTHYLIAPPHTRICSTPQYAYPA